ncbi:MAG TPA: Bax inhibitor-1/YccA family protein, partial [Puia sp.]|nr:Bax inhibitor-1/YccA family protein [Puia sp.]
MELFKSNNPTLSEKIFNRSLTNVEEGKMTARGAIQKFGFLLLMVFAGAGYTWNLYAHFKLPTMMTYLWVGLIGGLITAIVISYKPNLAGYLSPAYGILEGFVVGALSAIVNDQFKAKYPNI